MVLNFLFDSPSNLLTCGAVLSFDQLSEAANSVVLTHLLLWEISNEQALCSPNVTIVFKLFLPSAPRGITLIWFLFIRTWDDSGSVNPRTQYARKRAAPLRSYHEEGKFSGDPHE